MTVAAPYGVDVTSREDSNAIYYFLMNLTETVHGGIRLPKPMDNLITGDSEIHEVSLGPLDIALLSSRR